MKHLLSIFIFFIPYAYSDEVNFSLGTFLDPDYEHSNQLKLSYKNYYSDNQYFSFDYEQSVSFYRTNDFYQEDKTYRYGLSFGYFESINVFDIHFNLQGNLIHYDNLTFGESEELLWLYDNYTHSIGLNSGITLINSNYQASINFEHDMVFDEVNVESASYIESELLVFSDNVGLGLKYIYNISHDIPSIYFSSVFKF